MSYVSRLKDASPTSTRRKIYILSPTTDHQEWNKALSQYFDRILWFSSYESLMTDSRSGTPSAVIVDLDYVPLPLSSRMKTIREMFQKSELFAIASEENSDLALQCMKLGFEDFAQKPVGANEISWMIRKNLSKDTIRQESPKESNALVTYLTQISNSATPALVHLSTIECLHHLVSCEGAAWLNPEPGAEQTEIKITCSRPRNVHPTKVVEFIHNTYSCVVPPIKRSSSSKDKATLLLPCGGDNENYIFLWGIKKKVSEETLQQIKVILEYSYLSLMSLKKNNELKRQTYVDDLTNLYNSRYFRQAIGTCVSRASYNLRPFSVLFIDIDHFKKVNDNHGHIVGSNILIALAETLKKILRNVDLIFRYGGDEFVIILNDADQQSAIQAAERIRRSVEEKTFETEKTAINITVSIGVATYPYHATSKEMLLEMADNAMYSAKRASRNAVHCAKSDQLESQSPITAPIKQQKVLR